jgi:tetratricopeptide (TPR) repeat protein
MRTIGKTLLAALAVACFAGSLSAGPSEDLFAKTHKGMKEADVGTRWYDKLPEWVASLTSKNQFPETHLPFSANKGKLQAAREYSKFQIRDANKKQFSAYYMVRNGVDANGRTIYEKTNDFGWLPWKSWPARSIVETYPVESNQDINDLVALAAWLYGEKENELANRVLTVVHARDKELAPLIEAFICDKEKWTLPSEGLKAWNAWDVDFQLERIILVTPEEYDKRFKARESEAAAEFKKLVQSRGDTKGRPPRRVSPSKQLILIEWEIKQFKIRFGSSDFLKDTKITDKLQEIQDSITDDLALIKDNLEQARKMAPDSNANDLKKKAEFLEQILLIDPQDLNLRSQVANAWYTWGNPAPHGNSCDRADGMKKAIPHYEIIVKAYPNNSSFLLAMGRCYQALENSKQARPYYEKVIEIDGNQGNGVTAKALIRNMDQGDQNRSKKDGK